MSPKICVNCLEVVDTTPSSVYRKWSALRNEKSWSGLPDYPCLNCIYTQHSLNFPSWSVSEWLHIKSWFAGWGRKGSTEEERGAGGGRDTGWGFQIDKLQTMTFCQPFFFICRYKYFHYPMSNSRECMRVNGEALQLREVSKSRIFFSTSHAIHIRYYKWRALVWTCNEIKINHHHHSTKLYQKISLICCFWCCYSCCALITIRTATKLWYFQ